MFRNSNDTLNISEAVEFGTVCVIEPIYAIKLPHEVSNKRSRQRLFY
jgi:hypothetical protein